MTDLPAAQEYGALVALIVFIAASVWLGALAQRAVEKGSFVQGYFLGNRGLGVWALALTATVQSGGTFMGFPSLVYKNGWVGALFIAAYMVVPITGFGVVGKRIAEISRKTGAITVPDLFRDRFQSPALGLVASLLIMVFLSFMMVAQFKAGAIVMKLSLPWSASLSLAEDDAAPIDWTFYIGLIVFSTTVIGYTLIGGFLAAVWTDLFQSVMMLFGVATLFCLALYAAGGLENATLMALEKKGPTYLTGPGFDPRFLPISTAISYFFLWPLSGFSSPASVVRIMAVRDTATLRRSIVVLCLYNMGIYIPIIIICICARAVMPALPDAQTDEAIPRMTFFVTKDLPGGSLLAGLILAAPFGAVMATVSSYLVVIASGLVRDIYQRFINPRASQGQIKAAAYGMMITVGVLAVLANIRPVEHLQKIVVFSTTSTGSAFLAPLVMLCYWRRANAVGALAAMTTGVAAVVALYVGGILQSGDWTKFDPLKPLGFDPMIWGNATAFTFGITVTYLFPAPPRELVERFFSSESQP